MRSYDALSIAEERTKKPAIEVFEQAMKNATPLIEVRPRRVGKAQGIHLSWDSLRDQFDGQERVTVVLHRDDGQIYHIRKATRPEPHQPVLYNALGVPHLPGKTEKTVIDPSAEVTQM